MLRTHFDEKNEKLFTSTSSSSSSTSSSTSESQEEDKGTTAKINSLFKAKPKDLSWRMSIFHKELNDHLPTASFEFIDMNALAATFFSLAIRSGKGAAQTWLAFFPMIFFTDPVYIQQLIFNKPNLIDGETGGFQERFIGEEMIISLPSSDKRYPPLRKSVMQHLFTPIHKLASPTQTLLNNYIDMIEKAALEGSSINLKDLAARVGITLISHTQLGLTHFPEKYKSKFANLISEILEGITDPYNIAKIHMENFIRRKTHRRPNLARKLAALEKKAEDILKMVIDFNEEDSLEHLKSITGNFKLQGEELVSARIMAYMKLFLVGGFGTTHTTILFGLILAGDPDNKSFMDKLREELFKKMQEKPIEEWDTHDLEELKILKAFVLEILRLYPPFSYRRFASEKPFILASDISPLTDARETKEELFNKITATRDLSHDVHVPKGTMLFTSIFDAHRYKSLYGEDADQFNPDRWLGPKYEKFSLKSIMNQFIFFSLGNGPRACPGRLLATQTTALFLARILAKFDLKHNFTQPYPIRVGFILETRKDATPMGVFTAIENPSERKEERERFRL